MKQLFALACVGIALGAHATTHELTNSGFTFSPSVLTIVAGDQVHVVLPEPHTCTQVSQDTWNANGNTPLSGGFNEGSGDHTFTLNVPGTYYFVCIPHASMGMKGQIIVTDGTGIIEGQAPPAVQLLPNPANNTVQLMGTLTQGTRVAVYDVNGRVAIEMPVTSNATLDVSGLDAGEYTVLLKAEGSSAILRERLVIVR